MLMSLADSRRFKSRHGSHDMWRVFSVRQGSAAKQTPTSHHCCISCLRELFLDHHQPDDDDRQHIAAHLARALSLPQITQPAGIMAGTMSSLSPRAMPLLKTTDSQANSGMQTSRTSRVRIPDEMLLATES